MISPNQYSGNLHMCKMSFYKIVRFLYEKLYKGLNHFYIER